MNSKLARLQTHLVNVNVRHLKQTVAIFGHFWDFKVQLQISDWKVTQVLNLRQEGVKSSFLISSNKTQSTGEQRRRAVLSHGR